MSNLQIHLISKIPVSPTPLNHAQAPPHPLNSVMMTFNKLSCNVSKINVNKSNGHFLNMFLRPIALVRVALKKFELFLSSFVVILFCKGKNK